MKIFKRSHSLTTQMLCYASAELWLPVGECSFKLRVGGEGKKTIAAAGGNINLSSFVRGGFLS